ncbi:MAG: hypothetical protein ACYDDA_14715 [Acidiferrobacteraceae bacterium]
MKRYDPEFREVRSSRYPSVSTPQALLLFNTLTRPNAVRKEAEQVHVRFEHT